MDKNVPVLERIYKARKLKEDLKDDIGIAVGEFMSIFATKEILKLINMKTKKCVIKFLKDHGFKYSGKIEFNVTVENGMIKIKSGNELTRKIICGEFFWR